jgi:hypothetical protein
MSDHPLVRHARDRGPIGPGEYRAVVLESDDRITLHDFDSFAQARAYAYDCASETDSDNPPIAIVVDSHFSHFSMVEKGGHYAALQAWEIEHQLVRFAREKGRIAPGAYRTVESDSGSISIADHASFDEALAAAQRGELAIVVDWKFVAMWECRPTPGGGKR